LEQRAGDLDSRGLAYPAARVRYAERIPREHPLKRIKQMADAALKELSPIFDEIYSVLGRPSIPPERLLKASLLMALYTIRSERMFCEQLDYNLLFRWFLNLELDEPSFDHSSFSANRKRLLGDARSPANSSGRLSASIHVLRTISAITALFPQ
jgi:transposase